MLDRGDAMQHLKAYAATLVVLVALDAVWLAFVANAFFKSELGPLLRAQPDLVAAGLFYLIYPIGVVALAVAPSLRERSGAAAAWRGAVLGLTAYATFDLTSLAIIEGWTRTVAMVDIAWGAIVSAVASIAGYGITRALSSDSKKLAH
jgi:uncharacterized membrane protein